MAGPPLLFTLAFTLISPLLLQTFAVPNNNHHLPPTPISPRQVVRPEIVTPTFQSVVAQPTTVIDTIRVSKMIGRGLRGRCNDADQTILKRVPKSLIMRDATDIEGNLAKELISLVKQKNTPMVAKVGIVQ
ncbi:hypothetical protein BCR33DRAFT_716083 [Rhizoclosmatium globosum]|uniref:Uncharacterized protein n=1 Tax=Rhizoclosmatium globosum TaxID=329046 RepID=A0A1Y2CGN7_9FUNG|nr:hypothetical protein BCR33DRAFT_716083 [Rhizoclosmatium globosum]|eukprot:ORY46077.1 hypothetical protein BCR33DRAFT_716083 [Rhizoclosmatium globosum]